MVNIFQRYILVFLSKAKRALFKPFQLRALSLSLFGRAPVWRQVQELPRLF